MECSRPSDGSRPASGGRSRRHSLAERATTNERVETSKKRPSSVALGRVDDVGFDAGAGLAQPPHGDAVIGDEPIGVGVEVEHRAGQRLAASVASGANGTAV